MQPGTLTVMGTGHSEAGILANVCGLLTGRGGLRLLLDAGPRIKSVLQSFCLGLEDIDAVFVSHLHGDAVFGLERLAFESRFRYERRHGLFVHERIADALWDGFLRTLVGDGSDPPAAFDDLFDVHRVDAGFVWDGIGVDLVEASHTRGLPTHGLSIDGRVLWMTDTSPIPELDLDDHEVIFHDLTTRDQSPVHSARPALLDTYSAATRSRMWLIGYEDDAIGRRDRLGAGFAGLAWPGQVVAL